MDKKTIEEELFDKACEIASSKGQIITSKYVDPERSGALDNHYHLISTQGKLLTRIPLDRLNSWKPEGNGNGCGCGGFLLGVILTAIGLPKWLETPEQTGFRKTVEAMNTIATIAKECVVKKTNREINPTFDVPTLDNYTFKPENGNCDGDENNLLTAKSQRLKKFPTFSYNVKTRERTCSHEGPTGELNGCSSRRNGEW